MLTRTPACVQRRNFDPRNSEIGNGSYAGIEDACFEEAEDAIETVCSSSSDDVIQCRLFMCINLSVHHEATLSVGDFLKLVELTIGRNTMKQMICAEMKIL